MSHRNERGSNSDRTGRGTVRWGRALVVLAAAGIAAQGWGADQVGAAGKTDKAPAPDASLAGMSLTELMAIEIATVTTASKKPEKASAAPATVVVMTARDIRLRGYATLKDVLRDLPGMETIEYYFSEFGTQVPVRGINGNNKIVVLVNGMRVNPPGGENFPFRNDFSVRNAERIEVIYGPGSTLYGQDAISAVINVITKKPGDKAEGEAGAAGGVNSEREGWGTFGGTLDRAGKVRLSGHAFYHDSELTGLDKEYPAWWRSYGETAAPRGSGVTPYRQDFGLNFFARLDVYDAAVQVWHRDSRRSSSESGYPPAYVKEAIWEDRSTVVEAKHTAAFSDSTKLDSVLTYNRYEIDPDTRYVFPVPGLTNQWFLNDYKYGIGEGATLEETLRTELGKRVSLLCGAMAGTYNSIPKSTVPGRADPDGDVVAQGGAWEYTVGADPTRHQLKRVVESEYQTYAAYSEAAWRIMDNVNLIGGVRATKDTRFDDIPLTPRAAVVCELMEALTLKYIYTRAYVAPAPYFANATYDNGQLLATSNPNLTPEKATTHEVNLDYRAKTVHLGASGYYGEQQDIVTVSDFGAPENIVAQDVYLNGDPAQHRVLAHSVNGGCGRRYGADLYGQATLGAVSVWCSYSYVDSEQTQQGVTRQVPGLSRHNGRMGVTWAATERLFITPSAVVRSTPESIPAGALADELRDPWEINLNVLYEVNPHVDVFAMVRNVTDHHYALAGFGDNGKAIPQETLNGVIGLRGSF